MGAPVFVAGCAFPISAGGTLGFEPLLRPSAGMCPRRGTFFSCVAKKRRQKKATPLSASPALRFGATCGARGRGALRNSLRACGAPLKQPQRVSSRSACVLRHTRHPARCAPRRIQRGWGADIHSGHRFARPNLAGACALRWAQACGLLNEQALASTSSAPTGGGRTEGMSWLRQAQPERMGEAPRIVRSADQVERSDDSYGCSAVWMFGCPPPVAAPAAGRLRGGMGVAAPMLRHLTRCGCLNEAATQRSEFHGAPRKRTAAGLPRSAAQGSQTWGRPFFGDFLSAKRKKVTALPGALPGSRPMQRHAAKSTHKPQLRQAQPERAAAFHAETINFIAACAYSTSARAQKHLKTQRPAP